MKNILSLQRNETRNGKFDNDQGSLRIIEVQQNNDLAQSKGKETS